MTNVQLQVYCTMTNPGCSKEASFKCSGLLYNVNCTEINYKGIVTTEAVDEVDVPLTITHTCSFCLNKENGGEISHYAFD